MSRRASVPSRAGQGGKRVVTRKAGGKDEERRGTKRKRPEGEEDADEREEKRARLCVEEALTECAKRDCPWCGRAIVKVFGCNQMSCVCGRGFCYNCGKAYCIGRCAPKQPLSLAEAARTACRNLKKQNPSLTFRQCQAIIGKNWLKKEEVRPDDECDDGQSSDDDVGDENESTGGAVGGENSRPVAAFFTSVFGNNEVTGQDEDEEESADESDGDENSSSEDEAGDDDCDSASDSGYGSE